TTGTALIPCSASSFAASRTVAFSSTVITTLVITSIARIGTSLDRFHHHLKAPVAPTCIEPDQPGQRLPLFKTARFLVPASDRSGAFLQFFSLPTEFLGATLVKDFARRGEHLVLFAIYVLPHQILELRDSFQP